MTAGALRGGLNDSESSSRWNVGVSTSRAEGQPAPGTSNVGGLSSRTNAGNLTSHAEG